MHELGVVFYVIRDVNQVARQNHVSKVHSVVLEIGEVSGILHDYLLDCWNWAIKKEPVLSQAELLIREIPGVTCCGDCGGRYETVKYARVCPYCGSENTWLLQGNEFNIKEIHVYEEEAGKPPEGAGSESPMDGMVMEN